MNGSTSDGIFRRQRTNASPRTKMLQPMTKDALVDYSLSCNMSPSPLPSTLLLSFFVAPQSIPFHRNPRPRGCSITPHFQASHIQEYFMWVYDPFPGHLCPVISPIATLTFSLFSYKCVIRCRILRVVTNSVGKQGQSTLRCWQTKRIMRRISAHILT